MAVGVAGTPPHNLRQFLPVAELLSQQVTQQAGCQAQAE